MEAQPRIPVAHRTNTGVAFTGAVWYSGSTLLGLMLGSHPSIFYAGELHRSRILQGPEKFLGKCVCRVCGPGCAIWDDLHFVNGQDLYEILSRRTHRPVVFDSTKATSWIEHQAAALRDRVPIQLIVLVRDGRAVVNSLLRKLPQISAGDHAEAWATQMRATEDLASRFPGAVHRVRYEDLVLHPEPTLRVLADFLGMAFDPAMLDPWSFDQHPLGGNSGPLLPLLRQRAQCTNGGTAGVVGPDKKTRDWYDAHPREIVLDLRWKEEMSPDALAAFEAIAGEANRPYAWDELIH